MSLEYFEKYILYYDCLKDNTSIVSKSNSCFESCSNQIGRIDSNYFERFSECKWNELGKEVITNSIFVGLKIQLNNLLTFIGNNLVRACDLSINSLYPKIEEIKEKNEELDRTIAKISVLETTLDRVLSQLNVTPSTITYTSYNEITNEEITYEEENPQWRALKNSEESLNKQISDLDLIKEELINLLNELCEKADEIIEEIKELSLSDEKLSNTQNNLEVVERFLSGEELVNFKKENNIPTDDTIIVKKLTQEINGVAFDTYFVYDTQCTEEENYKYEQFIDKTLNYASLVDSNILQLIQNSGSSIIFEQTINCDGGSKSIGWFNGAAYCNSINRNVVVFYPSEEWCIEWSTQSIVHELGHAFDFTLLYGLTGETGKGISNFDMTSEGVIGELFKENSKIISWGELIEIDADNMLNTASDFSLYSLENFRNSHTEFFAEAFKEYYLNEDRRERLEFYAPDTYATMDYLIKNAETILPVK